MPKCDTCGNDYDKSFQVIAANKSYTFDSFRMRHQHAGADMRALQGKNCWAWAGKERHHILLQPLRRAGGGDGTARSIIATATCSASLLATKMPAKCSKRSAGPLNYWAWLQAKLSGGVSQGLCRNYLRGQLSTHWQGIYLLLKKRCWRWPGDLFKSHKPGGKQATIRFFSPRSIALSLGRSTANLDYPIFADAVLKLRRELVAVIPCADLTI